MIMDEDKDNPMDHPEEQASGSDDSPKFGRLLLILIAAVALIGVLTLVSEALYS